MHKPVLRISSCLPIILILMLGSASADQPVRDDDQKGGGSSNRRAENPTLRAIIRAEDQRSSIALEPFLKHADPIVRARAIRAMGRIQDPSLIGYLLDHARTDEPAVRAEAIFAIGQMDSRMAEEALLELLPGVKTLEDRLRVIDGLGKTSRATGSKVLVSLLFDRDPHVCATAASALENLAYRLRRKSPRWEPSEAEVGALLTLLKTNRPPEVVSAATGALWRFAWVPEGQKRTPVAQRDAVIEALKTHLQDGDVNVRMRVLDALGEVCAPDAIPSELGRALEDTDWRVRVNAANAIAGAAPDRAWPLLLEQQLQDPHPLVVLASLRALETLAKRYGKSPGRAVYAVSLDPARPMQVRAEALRIAVAFQEFGGVPAPAPFGVAGPATQRGKILVPADWKAEWRMRRALAQGSAQYLESGLSAGGGGILSQYQATVRPFLSDTDPRVRVATIEALGTVMAGDPPAQPSPPASADDQAGSTDRRAIRSDLLASLRDKDMIVRTAAADVLAAQGDKDAVPAIVDTLEGLNSSNDVEVMTSLIVDLEKLKDARGLAVLQKLADDSNVSVARAAAHAVGAISNTDPEYRKRAHDVVPVPPDALALVDRFPADRTLRAVIHTRHGDLTIKLFTPEAPLTVYNFVRLARSGYFDGLTFHRVVPNFVVQGGDPRGDGWGGPGYNIRCEYNPLRYGRGTVGMALAGKDTGGSQFFITHSPQPRLNGRYTIFGQLEKGGEVLDMITEGDTMKVEIVEE